MIAPELLELSTKAMGNIDNCTLADWYVFSRLVFCMIAILCQLEEGSARLLVKTFDVKKRVYYGNTSMEAEMSLLMANQTLVRIVSC